MKIRDRYTRGVSGTGPLRGKERAETTAAVSGGVAAADRVNISGRGVEIQRARSLALAAPEVREEMVDALLAQIARGEYQVTGREVAPRMVREHLMLSRVG